MTFMSTFHEGQAKQTPNMLGISAADVSGNGSTKGHQQPSIDPPPSSQPAFGDLFPMLSALGRSSNLSHDQALRDVFVLGRIHLTTSAVPLFDALRAWGLDPANCILFRKDYPYAHGEAVIRALRDDRKVRILSDAEMTDAVLDEVAGRVSDRDLWVMTIEDGAKLVERIVEHATLAAHWVGGAEQTTRGTWMVDRLHSEGRINVPVVALSHSRIKPDFEGPRIAASGLHGCLNLFPHACLKGWNVAVLGAGAIGKNTIAAFGDWGCHVSAYDADPNARLLVGHLADRVCRTAVDAVADADLILGTTGRESITRDVIMAAPRFVKIGSLSSEQVELDLRYLRQMATRSESLRLHPEGFSPNPVIGTRYFLPPRDSRVVDVLFNGTPLNFSQFGVCAEQAIDLIVSWLALCSLEVARGTFHGQTGSLKTAADLVFNTHELAAQYERIYG